MEIVGGVTDDLVKQINKLTNYQIELKIGGCFV